MTYRVCTCGNDGFEAHQICRHLIRVDGNNDFIDDTEGVYGAEQPYGPFQCLSCGKEYAEFEDIPEQKKRGRLWWTADNEAELEEWEWNWCGRVDIIKVDRDVDSPQLQVVFELDIDRAEEILGFEPSFCEWRVE